MADITITILNAQTNATEAITLPPATEISFLKELAAPLVNASPSDPILYEVRLFKTPWGEWMLPNRENPKF